MPDDKEEMALTVNGRKRKLTRKDFETFGATLKIPAKSIASSFEKFNKNLPAAHTIIERSFLPDEAKKSYHGLLDTNGAKLGLL